jgi:hypothetical protein
VINIRLGIKIFKAVYLVPCYGAKLGLYSCAEEYVWVPGVHDAIYEEGRNGRENLKDKQIY